MANFGETLFGGRPFVRSTLTPFVLLFAVLMPFLIPSWTPTALAITVGIEIMCLALLAGFWLTCPIRAVGVPAPCRSGVPRLLLLSHPRILFQRSAVQACRGEKQRITTERSFWVCTHRSAVLVVFTLRSVHSQSEIPTCMMS